MNQTQEQQQERLQQLFDKACTGVIRQGCQARNHRRCLYYDPTTKNRCAVGLLVSEQTAKKWAKEGRGSLDEWGGDWSEEITKLIGIKTQTEWELMQDLQTAHDSWSEEVEIENFTECFIKQAQIIADRYNLDTKVLKRSH